MTREKIIAAFFFLLFLFVLYQLFLIFSPFFHSIFWAGILAFVFYPLHRILLPIFRGNHASTALASTLFVLVLVIPIAFFMISAVVVEGAKLYDLVSETFTSANIKILVDELRKIDFIHYALNRTLESEELQKNLPSYVLNVAKPVGNYAAGLLASATKNILVILVHLMLVIFLMFFFFADGERWLEALKDVLPMEKKHRNEIFQKVGDTLSAVVRGQMVTAFIQGVIAGVVFWILGLPIPLFFGFLTFLASMIPVTGAATVWVPFVLYLLSIHQAGKAVFLLLIGTFVISLLDNFLKPVLIGEKTKLPILLLFFGILGGLKLYGLTGIFMGPVIIALAFSLIQIYQAEYMTVKNKA